MDKEDSMDKVDSMDEADGMHKDGNMNNEEAEAATSHQEQPETSGKKKRQHRGPGKKKFNKLAALATASQDITHSRPGDGMDFKDKLTGKAIEADPYVYIASSKEKISNLERRISEWDRGVHTTNEARKQAASEAAIQLLGLQKDIESLKLQIDIKENISNDLKVANDKISELENENYGLNQQLGVAQKDHEQAALKAAALLKDIDQLRSKEIKEATKAKELAMDDARKAKLEVDRMLKIRDDVKKDVKDLEQSNKGSELVIRRLVKERDQVKTEMEEMEKQQDVLKKLFKTNHEARSSESKASGELMEQVASLKEDISSLTELCEPKDQEIEELKRQNEELRAMHSTGSDEGGRSLGDELADVGDDDGDNEKEGELETDQKEATLADNKATQTDYIQDTSIPCGPAVAYVTCNGASQTEFGHYEASKIATVKPTHPSTTWLLVVLAVLFALFASVFAFYHAYAARQERLLWLEANDFSRRGVILLQNAQSAGSWLGWLTRKKVDFLTEELEGLGRSGWIGSYGVDV